MHESQHFGKRKSQRNISPKAIEMVMLFGIDVRDRRILSRKGCKMVLEELEKELDRCRCRDLVD